MSEKQPKKKKTAGDVVLTVVLIAAICVFCYAGYNLFHIYTEYKKGTDEYNSITQMAVTERDPDGEAAGPEAGSELKAPMDIDFASLKSVNNDVVGWIYVEAVPDMRCCLKWLDRDFLQGKKACQIRTAQRTAIRTHCFSLKFRCFFDMIALL